MHFSLAHFRPLPPLQISSVYIIQTSTCSRSIRAKCALSNTVILQGLVSSGGVIEPALLDDGAAHKFETRVFVADAAVPCTLFDDYTISTLEAPIHLAAAVVPCPSVLAVAVLWRHGMDCICGGAGDVLAVIRLPEMVRE